MENVIQAFEISLLLIAIVSSIIAVPLMIIWKRINRNEEDNSNRS